MEHVWLLHAWAMAWLATASMEHGWPRSKEAWLANAGLRDVDEGEWSHIHRLSIAAFSMKQIDRLGITAAVHTALHTIDPLGVGTFGNRGRAI
jgi:arginase family enzyme